MNTPTGQGEARVRLGIGLLLLCTLLFALMDGVSKDLITRYSVSQIMAIRYFAFVLALVLFTGPTRVQQQLRVKRPLRQILRALLLAVEQVVFILGLFYLALADAHVIMAATPLLVTALSVPMLGEKVGIRRWSAVTLGFLGVILILQPGGDLFRPAVLFPISAVLLFALYQIMTRIVAADDSPQSTTLYTAIVGAVVFGVMAPFDWRPPSGEDWLLLAVVAVLGGLGHALMIRALAFAPASVLQPFFYMTLVWAIGVGLLFFGAFPSPLTLAGAAVIVAAGLYTLYRQRLRSGGL